MPTVDSPIFQQIINVLSIALALAKYEISHSQSHIIPHLADTQTNRTKRFIARANHAFKDTPPPRYTFGRAKTHSQNAAVVGYWPLAAVRWSVAFWARHWHLKADNNKRIKTQSNAA